MIKYTLLIGSLLIGACFGADLTEHSFTDGTIFNDKDREQALPNPLFERTDLDDELPLQKAKTQQEELDAKEPSPVHPVSIIVIENNDQKDHSEEKEDSSPKDQTFNREEIIHEEEDLHSLKETKRDDSSDLESTEDEDAFHMTSHHSSHFAATSPDSPSAPPDEDDIPINSCFCEKKYDECASAFWNISGGWWNLLGFSAGQAAAILQVLSTVGTDHPNTFSHDTLLNFMIASTILTQASASLHALQAYALQTAQSRAHMANRIHVVTKKFAQLKAEDPHRFKSMMPSHPAVDSDEIESTSCDPCIKRYNMAAGGFWRIAGGWFNVLGFITGQTSVILQAVSALYGGDTSLLIAGTVTNITSTVLHAFEAYAYKAAAERTKKAESILENDSVHLV